MVKIILTDWEQYPLRRKKKIKNVVVKCGLIRLLEGMSQFDSGSYFDCILIINCEENFSKTSSYRIPTFSFPQKTTNSEATYLGLMQRFPILKKVIFRGNDDMDIGAYNLGIKYLREKSYQGDVILMNSSVSPPNKSGWLAKYYKLFNHNENIGLCGITLNSSNTCIKPPPFDPHVQSFFLYTNMKVLDTALPNGLTLCASASESKDNLVEQGEIGISRQILDAGYSITCSAFPEFIYFKGDAWTIPMGDIRTHKKFRSLANKM